MSAPFVVGPDTQGVWIDILDNGDGSKTRIKFDRDRGLIVQRYIPAKIMQAVIETARHSRDIHRKGRLLGNTQRHWVPIASIPKHIDAELKQKLGPMKHDPKGWKKALANPDLAAFRTSEYRP